MEDKHSDKWKNNSFRIRLHIESKINFEHIEGTLYNEGKGRKEWGGLNRSIKSLLDKSLETLWEKEEMLVTRIFSYSNKVFYFLKGKISSIVQVSFCRLQILSIWTGVKFFFFLLIYTVQMVKIKGTLNPSKGKLKMCMATSLFTSYTIIVPII